MPSDSQTLAVVGTLLGVLIGGGIQAWSGARALRSAREEAAAQREHATATVELQLNEDRQKRLWTERRDLYVCLARAASDWWGAIEDLRGQVDYDASADARAHVPATVAELRVTHPVLATATESSQAFGRVADEIKLLCGQEVRDAVTKLNETLVEAGLAAGEGRWERSVAEEFAVAQQTALEAMRAELIHGGGPLARRPI